jgi:predicted histone-like DNA-binding protein
LNLEPKKIGLCIKMLFTMAIKVKAVERNVAFDKNSEKWAYVLQPELYSKLSQSKVITEAALRSGISKGAINAAWDAIGEVIKAWATEGHAVAIPGLGSMRFGLRSKSIADVNKVGSDLITTRRVIFVPNVEIKDELKRTSINITCYDRNGELVKRVTSSDEGNVEDPENEGSGSTVEGSGNNGTTEPGGGSGNGSVTPTDPDQGGSTGGGSQTGGDTGGGSQTGGGNDNPPAGDGSDEG